MDVMSIAIMLVIGGVAGWLAGLLMRGSGLGLISNIIVGIIGSVIGTIVGDFFANTTGMQVDGLMGTFVWAVIGAIILLFLISLFKRV
ncbi:MAG: GlsB/YeaQ/YmgE family stress response membrane protein [Thiotrichaceae bacterium]|nr:GlsB/YeaQ/YmgE family stress response membrane protein [Thiotrichaceae bacterium]